VETAVATFVIPTGQVEVTLLPEGGELVAGFDNRVYAEVVDPLGRPVTARGDIVDSDGRVVTEFATAHQGRGRFSLTPRAGERYRLQLHDPVATTVALPDVHRDGVVLRTIDDATDAGARLRFRLATSAPGPWLVGVFLRGTLVGETTVTGSGVQDASIALAASSAGVLRVTVFDSELQPVAERLVHRHSGRRIDIDVEIAHPTLTPGERQTVRLTTRDETGQAVAAMLGVAVTDQAVRDMAGERRIGIADRAWLVADVDEIENVEEFVGGTAAADQHVDLLLGTRGWRRLLWRERDLESMVATHGERARCFVVSEGYGQVPAIGEAGPDISALVAQAERARTAASWALGSVFGVLGLLVVFVSWRRFARWAKLSPTQFWTIHASVAAAGVALLLWLDLGHGTRPFFYEMFGHAERAAAFAAAPAGGELAVDAADMAYIRDFDVQVAQGAVVNLPRAGGPGNVDNFFFGRGGNDRLEAKLGRLRAGEPGANAGVWRVYYHADDSVFAHSHAGTGRREDFAETVYWSGALRTDMAGQASFDFDVSDRVTTWSIDIDAHGAARVGQLTAAFQTALPLHLEPVLPLEVSQGDRLRIPVAVLSNAPATEPVTVAARVTGSLMLSGPDRQAVVLRDGRGRAVIDVDVGEPSPDAAIEIAARSGRHQDSVHHPVRVVPRGFPHREGQSGVVDDTVVLELALPDQHVPGSMDSTLTFYPSPLATLGNGMTGMLREPCGCFEQASSSNYPNVMLLSFLEATGSDAPAMARRARGHLQRGYGLIAGYECSSRGFEWFGDNPGHEALSAYQKIPSPRVGHLADMAACLAELGKSIPSVT